MQNSPDKQYNRGILLAVIMISSFLNPFMTAVMNIALPRISEEFSMNAIGVFVSLARGKKIVESGKMINK